MIIAGRASPASVAVACVCSRQSRRALYESVYWPSCVEIVVSSVLTRVCIARVVLQNSSVVCEGLRGGETGLLGLFGEWSAVLVEE